MDRDEDGHERFGDPCRWDEEGVVRWRRLEGDREPMWKDEALGGEAEELEEDDEDVGKRRECPECSL